MPECLHQTSTPIAPIMAASQPLVAIRSGLAPRYPEAGEFFSPDTVYPEYALGHLSSTPNPVYQAVRELFAQAGLDEARQGSEVWNPLGAWIKPGDRVFVLCNFVCHRRERESEEQFQSKCTHASVLRPVIDYALRACGAGGSLCFGNAPLQSSDWNAVLHETGAEVLAGFYHARGYRVEARDLRQVVRLYNRMGQCVRQQDRREANPGRDVDLRGRSRLDELPSGPGRFRVTDYNPLETDVCHRGGLHRYRVSQAILDADVVISLPKLKTHEKVGITCGLKGFVGAIASKDCLAHHRYGSGVVGGDEYERGTAAERLRSWLHERAQKARGGAGAGLLQLLDIGWRRMLRRSGCLAPGAWHGNDTCWRMTLDIADILHHVDRGGVWHDQPVRRHLMVVDGIVGGQGEGPLNPQPARSGLLLFADDVAAGDRACCELMGFDPERVPLVRHAGTSWAKARVIANGADLAWENLREGRPLSFLPPPGWVGRIELPGTQQGGRRP